MDSLSSKLGQIAWGFEQQLNCKNAVMAVVLTSSYFGVDFYGGDGRCDIKNANFPNLQRTKNER